VPTAPAKPSLDWLLEESAALEDGVRTELEGGASEEELLRSALLENTAELACWLLLKTPEELAARELLRTGREVALDAEAAPLLPDEDDEEETLAGVPPGPTTQVPSAQCSLSSQLALEVQREGMASQHPASAGSRTRAAVCLAA